MKYDLVYTAKIMALIRFYSKYYAQHWSAKDELLTTTTIWETYWRSYLNEANRSILGFGLVRFWLAQYCLTVDVIYVPIMGLMS